MCVIYKYVSYSIIQQCIYNFTVKCDYNNDPLWSTKALLTNYLCTLIGWVFKFLELLKLTFYLPLKKLFCILQIFWLTPSAFVSGLSLQACHMNKVMIGKSNFCIYIYKYQLCFCRNHLTQQHSTSCTKVGVLMLLGCIQLVWGLT